MDISGSLLSLQILEVYPACSLSFSSYLKATILFVSWVSFLTELKRMGSQLGIPM
jgi:hypothetical protein